MKVSFGIHISNTSASIAQLKNGESSIGGIMLESNLVEGKQDIKNRSELKYGQSITDACIGWEETEKLIRDLNDAMESMQ